MHTPFVEKYFLVKLKKLQGEVTSEIKNIVGYAPYLPTPTQPFVLFGKNDDGTLRVLRTGSVQCSIVVNTSEVSFDTDSNTYHLAILDEATPQEVEEFLNQSVVKNNPAIDEFMAKLDVQPKTLN